jgi:hypothetical protein
VPSVILRPSPTFTAPRLSLVAGLILATLFSIILTPLTCTSSTLPPAVISLFLAYYVKSAKEPSAA